MDNILVEISARHVHLTKEDLATLFGEGYELTPKKSLSQPGQFACEERVDVVGPKREQKGVTILGPIRPYTQVELSLTDARNIGVTAPVRMSGDLENSGGCILRGPCGEITLEKGVIAAKRHIHMLPEQAAEYGVSDNQIVSAKVESDGRSLTFGDVVVRVTKTSGLAMHIDTDEGNAAGVSGQMFVELVK